MTPTWLFGLTLQIIAVLVTLAYLRSRWLASSGGLFVVVAFVYHGLSEIVQRVFPGHNFFRSFAFLTRADVDDWSVLAGGAMLCFAAAYLFAFIGLAPRRQQAASLPTVSRVPIWGILLGLGVLSQLAVLSGLEGGYWMASFTGYLGRLFLVMGCAGLVLRKGPAYAVPVALGSSMLLALGGTRSAVVLNVVLMLIILKRLNVPVRLSRLLALGLAVVLLVVLISAARVRSGRLNEQLGTQALADRLYWLSSGSQVASAGSRWLTKLSDDFTYRFDGNAFPALVGADLRLRHATPGLASFWRNFMLMVPSALMPGKLLQDPRMLFEENFSVTFYRLPEDVDYLPMTFGILYTYYAAPGLLAFALLLGLIYGGVDHLAIRPRSVFALLLGTTFSIAAMGMEQGTTIYFDSLRTLVVYFALVWSVRAGVRFTRYVMRALTLDLRRSAE